MNKKIQVYKGLHSQNLYQMISECWNQNQLLVISPPHIQLKENFLENLEIPTEAVFGIYTSGTLSGKPRLIFYSKKNIESSLNSIRKLYDFKKIDKIFCYPQPTHTFGLILGYIHSFLFQIPIVFSEGAYSSEAHQLWFNELSPGMLTLGTPTHFVDLISWLNEKQIQPKQTYSCIIGGAPVSKKLWNDIKNILKIDQPSVGYGATEASPGVTHLPPGVEPLFDGDVGYLLDGVSLHEQSEEGYFFSGANVCCGIVAEDNSVKRSDKIFIKDHLLIQEGRFVFNGRSDLLINRGGIKYSPEVIESKIYSDLNLKAACISFYNERLGSDLGFIIQAEDQTFGTIKNYFKNEFSLHLRDENFIFEEIPLTANAKYDRVEIKKRILKKQTISVPIDIKYLMDFMPHRPPAVWVNRIIDFKFRAGSGEVDLSPHSPCFSDGQFRESACVELVAQTYGYATVAYEIFHAEKATKANKTLIAEVRDVEFFFTKENRKLLQEAQKNQLPLTVKAICTHDFGVIKVIKGSVFIKEERLAELSLKAFVSEN